MPAASRSAYTALCAAVLFPLQERLKGHSTLSVLRELERSQWWDSARLGELQDLRVRNLLLRAKQRVPYYRGLFTEARFDPSGMRGRADLAQLPFLTKGLIRRNVEVLKATDARRLARFNTGGSSGEPMTFFLGSGRVSHDVAAKWRATRWWGVDIGDPEIVVWGSPIELGAQDRIREWRDRLMRTRLLPAFDMSPANLDLFLTRIRAARPRMLFGYPSALAHIAKRAELTGAVLNDLGIRVAFVTAEKLYPEQRAIIGRVFGCAVADGYGGRDAGFVAHQCPSGGMHVSAEDIIVEIVDGSGNRVPEGESGEIVVTHLASEDFPFIRYRTGDIAALDPRPCACGRGLPLLKEIQGRSTDFVVAADGTVMHGLALIYVLRKMSGIRAFKIVQESRALTRVILVTESDFAESTSAAITHEFQARLGEQVEVRVERQAEILPEASGKFRYVVSKVNAETAA